MSSPDESSAPTWTEGDFEHPNQKLRRSMVIALVFAYTLSTLSVALRILARKMTGSKLFMDDYLIMMALFFKYACSSGVVVLLFNGMGSHITMIPAKNLLVYFQLGFANAFIYTGCIAFIKFSILALYKRLFAVRHMTIAVNFMFGFIALWVVGVYVAGALLCIPVSKFWNPSIEGACLDPAKFYYGMQIPNIISDIILLIMPMNVVWTLPIPKSQKMLLSGVFLVGGLTLIFDIFRLIAMIKLVEMGPDITYNQVPVIVWTCIEAAVGIMAACLPNLRPLFKLGKRNFWSNLRSSNNVSEMSSRTLVSLGNPGGTVTSIATSHKKSDSYVIHQGLAEPQYEDYKDERAMERV
ncbi:uncharacterized protein N7479_004121 [Penicillium vulpinum]|uniref:Rhodopsin domain-containing protein n=1 Tax=Penicillium vulpinum TaxID=29845 RepID=A0A1V6SDR7_9EURO|nr:uncharacterized protein N7479_004121 [Penicillium vulpinum]KAJ5964245.1 hypothetical protein N7479_004121 [Penicillium vulpinum]OQE11844.1 hypothetical protein PENVUL_c002G00691 [Penicillium vulpinum]